MEKTTDGNFVRCVNVKTGEVSYNNKIYTQNRVWQNSTGNRPQPEPKIDLLQIKDSSTPSPVRENQAHTPVDFTNIKEEKKNDGNKPTRATKPTKAD